MNTLHILPAWNEDVVYKKEGNKVPVVVYSDAKKVELFFTPANGGEKRSLGEKEFAQKTTTAGYIRCMKAKERAVKNMRICT